MSAKMGNANVSNAIQILFPFSWEWTICPPELAYPQSKCGSGEFESTQKRCPADN